MCVSAQTGELRIRVYDIRSEIGHMLQHTYESN